MITLKNILVATDFGEAADAALAYGRELSRRLGAKLHLLHVADDIHVTTLGAEMHAATAPDLQRTLEDAARARLHDLVMDSDRGGPPTEPIIRTSSSPASAIIECAGERGIDLIVVGNHGRGAFGHLLMGSVAEKVARLAKCPVLTVRRREQEFVGPDMLDAAATADAVDVADRSRLKTTAPPAL